MSLEVADTLTRSLHRHNHWWESDATGFSLPARQRSDFYHLVRPTESGSQFLDQPILGLAGRQGVGKTTLLEQYVHHRVSTGDDPERYCYLPLDANPLYQLRSGEQLERAIRYYESRILGRLEDPTSHVLLLDDVHRVEHAEKPGTAGWATVISEALEDRPGRHIVVTASAGQQIGRALETAGVDRSEWAIQPILPEKFRDYLFTLLPTLERGDDRISPTPIRTGDSGIPRALETGDPEPLAMAFRATLEDVGELAPRVQSQLLEYAVMGGIASLGSDGARKSAAEYDLATRRRLRDDVRAALYQEVPAIESIQSIADLERLCTLAATTRGSEPLSIRECADAFGVDRRTLVDSYIPALEALTLCSGVTEYDNSRPRSFRLYLRDTGLVAALTDANPGELVTDLSVEADLARLVGFDHSMRLEYMINAVAGTKREPSVTYWESEDGEVDFVLTVGDTPLPVGLAYRPADREPTMAALETFQSRYDTPLGLLLVGDQREDQAVVVSESIIEVPYWLYVLLC